MEFLFSGVQIRFSSWQELFGFCWIRGLGVFYLYFSLVRFCGYVFWMVFLKKVLQVSQEVISQWQLEVMFLYTRYRRLGMALSMYSYLMVEFFMMSLVQFSQFLRYGVFFSLAFVNMGGEFRSLAWVFRVRSKLSLASDELLGLWWLRASMFEDGLDGFVLMKDSQLEFRCRSFVDILFSSLWIQSAGSQFRGGRGGCDIVLGISFGFRVFNGWGSWGGVQFRLRR